MTKSNEIMPCTLLSPKEADNLFFSEENLKKQSQAKALCAVCPAIESCLKFALDSQIEFGIFGGLTPQERKAL